MPTTSTRLHEIFPFIPTGDVAGVALLRELPRDVGMHVTRVYRSVMLWAAEPPEKRTGGMFLGANMESLAIRIATASPALGEAISQPLILIACELAGDEPHVPTVARACLAVADWALGRRAITTALAFADAAASVHANARYALVAGRLHRHHGTQQRAELWLRRASVLATRVGDWQTKVKAVLSLGSACLATGRYGPAGDHYRQALKFAVRHRLREQVGEAWHDLFILAIATNDRKAADAALREAVRHYGPRHHRLPAFAHDLALYWLERGDFENARTVLLALLERHWRDDPTVRMVVCGTALRALGGCAQADEFDRIYGEFWGLVDKAGETYLLAPALLSAARGAIGLRRWKLAESLLSSASEEARRTGLHDTLLQVEQTLVQVRERRTERTQQFSHHLHAHADLAQKTAAALGGGKASG